MAYIVMVYTVLACIVMACEGMAYVVMAEVVMARAQFFFCVGESGFYLVEVDRSVTIQAITVRAIAI